ncbi:hypothetical protein [Cysteiniphilum litorale]|uniref:Uncharacterized protein n=1 Tax=Cysteiniphilum litorale TaxID=2056700 RepID=A0A8J2Z6D6_9GAMM|nr:hypothetical protein [Cysteiniphilum litorale]GGG04491.1 hypothetical protein GCM10010995_22490 [Cysteiniphilum litorale]
MSFIKDGVTVATKEAGNSNLTLNLEPGQYVVQGSSVIDGDYEYDAAQQTVTISTDLEQAFIVLFYR